MSIRCILNLQLLTKNSLFMKYKLYTNSQKAWDGMFKAILAAEKSIYIEMYIFLSDTTETHDFLGLIKEKALLGLEIVIIADAFGSYGLRSREVRELREAGVEFIFFSHWFKRTHRKILIVDNNVALLGGVNINEKIRYWLDLQIEISGKIVESLVKSFAHTYQMIGGKKESILRYNKLSFPKKLKAFISDSLLTPETKGVLSEEYISHIFSAKESIKIVSPYFAPPKKFLSALENACLRGVKVEIIIPENTDIVFLDRINYLGARRLLAMGVDVYLSQKMNHAKMLLIDDNKGLIGSQNFDFLSFSVNIETGVFFNQKHIVSDLKDIFDKWLDLSEPANVKIKKITFFDKILTFFARLFYRLF